MRVAQQRAPVGLGRLVGRAQALQQQQRRTHQRLLGQCRAERNVVGAWLLRPRWVQGLGAERVFQRIEQGLAQLAQVGRDDGEAAAGVGGQPLLRPLRSGLDFGAGVGVACRFDLGRRQLLIPWLQRHPQFAHARQQRLLERVEAVEAGQAELLRPLL